MTIAESLSGEQRAEVCVVGSVKQGGRIHCAIAMGDQGIVMGWASGKNIARLLKGEKSVFLEMCSPQRFALPKQVI